MSRMTQEQFLNEYPDTAKFLDRIKERAPVKVGDLQCEVTYHPDPEMCENYMLSMLGLLDEFKFIKCRDGVVYLT